MKKFNSYYSSFTKFEKVIFVFEIVSSITVILMSIINLITKTFDNINVIELLLGINLGCNSLIKFKEHKLLSVFELAVAVFCIIVFVVSTLS